MASTPSKLVTGIAVAVALIFIGYLFIGGNQPQTLLTDETATSTPSGPAAVESAIIEPSVKDGVWTMYRPGAQVVVTGANLARVIIKVMPTGTGMGAEYPNGLALGEATKVSDEAGKQTWNFLLPEGVSATSLWAEGVGSSGDTVKSDDLGNVGQASN